MTVIASAPATRPVLPGWTLVTDLTPPELLERRRLRVLRRLIVNGLGLVLVVCLAGYALASLHHSAAQSALASEQKTTLQLRHEANRYAGITQLQTTVTGVNDKSAKLLADDVDTNGLITELQNRRPGSVSISSLSMTIFPPNGSKASQPQSDTVNLSGRPLIGAVTLTGSAGSLADVATYLEKLSALPGVVGVIPTSSQQGASAVQFSFKFGLTDQLLSHHYTSSAVGGH